MCYICAFSKPVSGYSSVLVLQRCVIEFSRKAVFDIFIYLFILFLLSSSNYGPFDRITSKTEKQQRRIQTPRQPWKTYCFKILVTNWSWYWKVWIIPHDAVLSLSNAHHTPALTFYYLKIYSKITPCQKLLKFKVDPASKWVCELHLIQAAWRPAVWYYFVPWRGISFSL